MQELTYTMTGGFRLPNVLPSQEPEIHLGKYALLRLDFLKQYRRVMYTNLMTASKLNQHLAEIQETAARQVQETVTQMAQAEGITEELKTKDQMLWIRKMNAIRHSAEEKVCEDFLR